MNHPLLSIVTTSNPDLAMVADFARDAARYAAASGIAAELVVVDDLGVPGAASLVRQIAGLHGLQVVTPAGRRGQLAAMLYGIAEARGDFVLAIDPDMAGNLPDIARFLAAARAGCDLVYGQRGRRDDTPPLRRALSWLLNVLIRRIAGVALHDVNTPMVLLSRRAVQVLAREIPPGIPPKLFMPARFAGAYAEVRIDVDGARRKRSTYTLPALARMFCGQLADAHRFRRWQRAQRESAA